MADVESLGRLSSGNFRPQTKDGFVAKRSCLMNATMDHSSDFIVWPALEVAHDDNCPRRFGKTINRIEGVTEVFTLLQRTRGG